jgi:hypothetical protein
MSNEQSESMAMDIKGFVGGTVNCAKAKTTASAMMITPTNLTRSRSSRSS